MVAAVAATAACAAAGPQAQAERRLGGERAGVAPLQRGDPVRLSGLTLDEQRVDTATWRGHVIVVNFWASGAALAARKHRNWYAPLERRPRKASVSSVWTFATSGPQLAPSAARKPQGEAACPER